MLIGQYAKLSVVPRESEISKNIFTVILSSKYIGRWWGYFIKISKKDLAINMWEME